MVKLQGQDAQGKFRTAAAKEYPSALCRSLVVAMIRVLRFRAESEGLRTPAHVLPTAKQWMRDAWNASHDGMTCQENRTFPITKACEFVQLCMTARALTLAG